MLDNYRSFLSLTFALNRFLKDCLLSDNRHFLPEKKNVVTECIRKVFPENEITNTPLNYKKSLDNVNRAIGLQKKLLSLPDGVPKG
jgi:hypothetical protein